MSYNPKDPKQNWLPDYVRQIADLFALRDWSFEILPESTDEEAAGMDVRWVFGRKYVHMRTGKMFWEMSGHDQRHLVVHELTHCHLFPADDWAESRLKKKEYKAFLMSLELATDGIADGIAPLMPLPPKINIAPRKGKE